MLSATTTGFGDVAAELRRGIAKVATSAMRETAIATRDELRQQTRSAGLGDRLPNTWTARAYPGGEKDSINPAGLVWSRAPDIMDAFTRGATIRPIAGAKYLWIPTDNVPPARARSGRMTRNSAGQMRPRSLRAGSLTPEECEDRFNTDFVMRKGRAGRLLAYMQLIRARNGRGMRQDSAGRRRQGREAKLTLMFVLVRSTKMPKLFDLDASADRWALRYEQAVNAGLASV